MEIYLIRHSTPAVPAGICYGHTDLDVTTSFVDEFEVLKTKLSILKKPRVFSSPLKRCLKLAQATSEHFNFGAIGQDPRLKELDFGDWEMQAWHDIPRGLLDIWGEEHVLQAPPKGESYHALHLRAKEFLAEVSADKHDVYLVFTHAGVIRALLAEALGLPLIHAFKFEIGYASVTKIIVDETVMRVAYVNL